MECLVTKLKASVNDDTLPKLGVVRFTLNPGEYSSYLTNPTGNSVLSLVSGSLTAKDYNSGADKPLPMVLSKGDIFISLNVGENGAVIEITDKYNITYLSAIWKALSPIPASDLNYMYSLREVNLSVGDGQKAGVVGDFAELKPLVNLERIYWRNELCTGDIACAGYFPKLTRLEVFGSKVYGDLVNIAKVARKEGRASGSITLGWLNDTGITFNGETITKKADSKLEWTANTITWNGTTINA